MKDGLENNTVVLKVRPLLEAQQQETSDILLEQYYHNHILFHSKHTYEFDNVLWSDTSQLQTFSRLRIQNMINTSLEGYSNTIVAYGQTSSGKTYTLTGEQGALGIIPRAASSIYNKLEKCQSFSLRASYLEIYNEQLKDLLNPDSTAELTCRWNASNGFYVENLMVVECKTMQELEALFNEGNHNRRTSLHALNKESSRSHSLLMLWIKTETIILGSKTTRYGKVTFVDLAGSERLKYFKGEGDMIKQTGSINKSLFALARVIKQLAERKGYIPYRDSKLTMLLMDSLGGASHLLMIACVSPSALYYEETLSTLQYASKMRKVQNRPILRVGQNESTLMSLRKEIKELRTENTALRSLLEKDSMPGEGFIVQEYRRRIHQLHTDIDKIRQQDQLQHKEDIFLLLEAYSLKLTENIEKELRSAKSLLKEAKDIEDRCQLIEEETNCMIINH